MSAPLDFLETWDRWAALGSNSRRSGNRIHGHAGGTGNRVHTAASCPQLEPLQNAISCKNTKIRCGQLQIVLVSLLNLIHRPIIQRLTFPSRNHANLYTKGPVSGAEALGESEVAQLPEGAGGFAPNDDVVPHLIFEHISGADEVASDADIRLRWIRVP